MSTKLDKWIEERFSQRRWSDPLTEAINEYLASRQWVEGPPPEGCNAAWVAFDDLVKPAVLHEGLWYTDKGWLTNDDILRHCPIPAAPPLPKPAIPDEVAKNGDGCYRLWFDSCTSGSRRIENNHVLRVAEDPMHVSQYAKNHGVISWKYLGDIPREVAEHGDGWYWRNDEIVRVEGNSYVMTGDINDFVLENDDCTWEYIPEPKDGE